MNNYPQLQAKIEEFIADKEPKVTVGKNNQGTLEACIYFVVNGWEYYFAEKYIAVANMDYCAYREFWFEDFETAIFDVITVSIQEIENA